jgi:hypothetical protein
MSEHDDWLDVDAAAAALDIQPRRLRRILQRPEWASRVQTVTRTTRTGQRQARLLPPDLVSDLRARIDIAPSQSDEESTDKETRTRPRGQNTAVERGQLTKRQVAAYYEAMLAERQRMIDQQAAHIKTLEVALDDARQVRDQALLAIPEKHTQTVAQKPPRSLWARLLSWRENRVGPDQDGNIR